jgi:hypothetical protein
MPPEVDDPNYHSGDDFVVEFVEHRYRFSADDFRERVIAAAVRLELVRLRDVSDRAAEDLVELVSTGRLPAPRSALGRYLMLRWSDVGTLRGESLVYWLRKLIFRGAWLDHRLKHGLLEVEFDPAGGDHRYRLPTAQRPLMDVARHPSWRDMAYHR